MCKWHEVVMGLVYSWRSKKASVTVELFVSRE